MGETSSRDKEFITYLHFDVYMSKLIHMISQSKILTELKGIVGIDRGGLPVAVHLSHFLDLPLENPNFLHEADYQSTIIVDDIADTGETLEHYVRLGFRYTATLFYKKRSIIKPTFYVRETDKWIVFPWEKPDEIPNRPE